TKTEIGAGWGTFRDLTIGRVNRDQYDDLLAVNDTNSQLILYTGTAAGTRFNEGVTYGRGWNCCTQITVGRFTNDDYDDLVTVNAAGQLLLYAGNAAAQSFDAGVVITGAGTGWSAYSYLAAGRFDGSGLDGLLAVDRATGQPWVHPRTEAGSWAARVQPPGTVWAPQPYELSNLVSGRFNGDEYADLLGTDSAGILWLHPGTSADTYGPRVQFGAGWIGYRELVVGKMNRDQYDDLAAIEQATGKLWLYPGNATGTPATTKTEIGAGWGTFRDLTIGRVNRDQYDDLLAVNDTNSQLILYTGTAAGTRFNEGVTYGRGWNCCTQITVGRFTNDDYDDLVTVNAAGQLLLYAGNAAAQSFDAGVVITDAGTGWANRSDLTRFRVTGDTHDSLLSKDRSGSLLVHRNTGGTFDWSDPVRSGPRD
ncbi:VCBS repeat-containing protein, partial [Jidongwangia harbinensis]|uniref:VCBS repeat-containing protein n=1 Tax=Jidongwangia harbinensis TaxID=2878561 RepID=UPI003558FC4E|nr:VCBS repeat-containing protein [Jidongwangia harbinensis]